MTCAMDRRNLDDHRDRSDDICGPCEACNDERYGIVKALAEVPEPVGDEYGTGRLVCYLCHDIGQHQGILGGWAVKHLESCPWKRAREATS